MNLTISRRGVVHNAALVLFGGFLFVFSFLFRFNDPGGAFAGLTDDHFFYLVRGWQILFGDLPVRDFVDHGAPLFYYIGAAVQLIGGRGTLSEIVFCAAMLSLGATATFLLAARASASVLLGVLAALVTILLEPRFYNYPKILVYVAAVPAIWAFIDRPSAGRRAWVGVVTAVAFLFRHDHGAFVGISMLTAIVLLPGMAWRHRLRHAVLYGALVFAALLPYLLFIQLNGGVGSYLAQASAWAARDRARAPVEWPGLFDNPDGVSAPARVGSGLTHAMAVVRDNSVAWLYWIELTLPFVAGIVLVLSPRAFRPGWPNAAVKIGTVAVMALVLNAGFLRGPLEARLADPSVPHAILIAWLCAACWHLLRRGRDLLRPQLASHVSVVQGLTVGLVAPLLIVFGVALTRNLYPRLDKAWLTGGLANALDRSAEIRETLQATWPLRGGETSDQLGVLGLALYLRDCTKPSDRVFVQPYLPQVIALSERAFAGGHADLRPGFFKTAEAQQLTLQRLQRQSVPVVVLGGEEYDAFRISFPMIAAYLDEHYTTVGERFLEERFTVIVLVSRTAVPTGKYTPLDLPCFR